MTLLLTLIAGLLAGNGLPHFIKGITKEDYPTVFGNGPVPNLIAGWSSLTIAAIVLMLADLGAAPVAATAGISLGVLAMGLFHAQVGAFGR
ncbi:hypothetical protein [Glycomyces sp. NPDC047010]|uniref:hypothetical protein n=1 Tax=Glycomyces sp. NPDC047010 TaxID=3155023 RepID=UPI0033F89626